MSTPTATPYLRPLTRPGKKIRVLVVDDSVVIRRLVTRMLSEDGDLEVVGSARNGMDALAKVEQFHPDVVTLDVEMPELDGIGALKLIQQSHPRVRVIMCSSLTERGAAVTIDALLAGASDYVTKDFSGEMSDGAFETLKQELTMKIKQLFGVPRTKQPSPSDMGSVSAAHKTFSTIPTPEMPRLPTPVAAWLAARKLIPQVLAIGVSTGGPTALAEILPMIPPNFPIPIVIVQHMPPLFTQLLAERLTKLSRIPVFEGKQGMEVKPGMAVIAPGNFHMRLVRKLRGVEVELNQETPENSCRPAVDVLFRSVAEVYGGSALAVILTGMGQDGLVGVRQLKALGAPVFVQDKATSVVWGMPGAVADAHLADAELPLKEIIPEVLRRI